MDLYLGTAKWAENQCARYFCVSGPRMTVFDFARGLVEPVGFKSLSH